MPDRPLDESKLRTLFSDAVRRSGAYGAQLTIIKGDQQLDLAEGYADVERGVAMTPGAVMQIGSITKVFNAAVVMSLVQEGLLDLDTPVKRYLPDFRVADEQATEILTLRHLLSMSSGLDNGRYVYFGTGEDALGKYVEYHAILPQHFPPGRFFGYSNAGTCIAGHVAATIAGKPWETLLRERILEPAGLTSAIVLDEDLPGKQVSSGHIVPPGEDKPTVVAPKFSQHRSRGPSGAFFAVSTADLARFGRMLLQRGLADTGERVLAEATVDEMTKRHIDVPNRVYANGWGIGCWMTEWNGVELFGHAGGTPTSASFMEWIPEFDGVFALNVNTPTASIELRKILATEITEAAFGISKPPTAKADEPLAPLNEHRYVGTYEQLGTRWHITRGEGETLSARVVPQRTPEEVEQQGRSVAVPERTVTLKPLGGDRFLLVATEGPDEYKDQLDTAFFGDDGEGRATNLLDGVMAASRI